MFGRDETYSSFRPMMKLAAVILLFWLLPLPLFYFFVGDFHFWRGLALSSPRPPS